MRIQDAYVGQLVRSVDGDTGAIQKIDYDRDVLVIDVEASRGINREEHDPSDWEPAR